MKTDDIPVLDLSLWAAAATGVFILFGALGSCDYAEEYGLVYEASTLYRSIIFGFLCILPAVIRAFTRDWLEDLFER